MHESAKTTPENASPKDRVEEVRQIFAEFGFGNAELLEGWDGVEPEELADLLSEDEMQTLLDELRARDL